MLSPFECLCGNFILPEPASYVFFMHFSICATDGDDTVKNLLSYMKEFKPFRELEMNAFHSLFLDYNIFGGMSAVVAEYIERNTFEGSFDTQMQLIADYKEDIRRYAPESIKQELSVCSTGSRRSLQGKIKNPDLQGGIRRKIPGLSRMRGVAFGYRYGQLLLLHGVSGTAIGR